MFRKHFKISTTKRVKGRQEKLDRERQREKGREKERERERENERN